MALNSWAIANVSLSATTTVLCTVMIVARIWKVTRLPTANLSLGVIEVFVESAALYAIASLIYIAISEPITHATDVRYLYAQILFSTATVSRLFHFIMHSKSNSRTQAVSPSLLLLRVALGRARPDAAWTTEEVSEIVFQVSSHNPTGSVAAADAGTDIRGNLESSINHTLNSHSKNNKICSW
jgi:hypothetical protein